MKRRGFIAGIIGALCAPFAARAVGAGRKLQRRPPRDISELVWIEVPIGKINWNPYAMNDHRTRLVPVLKSDYERLKAKGWKDWECRVVEPVRSLDGCYVGLTDSRVE